MKNTAYAKRVMANRSVNVQQKQQMQAWKEQTQVFGGGDVGKASFSAALALLTENGMAKITSLPCRDFKRTPEGIEQFFQWAKKTVPGHDIRI